MQKQKAWSLTKADTVFSNLIRLRDRTCVRCGVNPATDCSHYFERHHSTTRFDPRNGDGLCRECHQIWEGRKNGYKEYKARQLGAVGLLEITRLSAMIMNRGEAIIRFQNSLKI